MKSSSSNATATTTANKPTKNGSQATSKTEAEEVLGAEVVERLKSWCYV
ncbi:MAG: hypothetical protein OK455_09110 [Thaumarchaeota archaeon]|nr:hypothetical protein [Nitrososphaerota archaeon]